MKVSGKRARTGHKWKQKHSKQKIGVRLTAAIFLTALLLLAIAGAALAGFATTQLTNNAANDQYPQMNNAGQVVWQGWDGTDMEIYLYSGGVTTQLSNNSFINPLNQSFNDVLPRINNSGEVVWTGGSPGVLSNDRQIFLYSGGVTTQLTNDNNFKGDPRINDNSQVVWWETGASPEIWLYFPGSSDIRRIYTEGYLFNSIHINNAGQVVWAGWDGNDYEIYLYSPGSFDTQSDIQSAIQQISNNDYDDVQPDINDSGKVVWTGRAGEYCDASGCKPSGEIFSYSGGTTLRLTNDSAPDHSPWLSEEGSIVWEKNADAPGDSEIMLSRSGRPGDAEQLTDNNYDDSNPQIPDHLHAVVWWGSADGSDQEIYLYSGGVTTQLTNNSYPDFSPQINDSGQVTWYGWDGTDSEIFLASPCTDGKASLSLSRTRIYWASYADYTNRILSVDYSIANGGSVGAHSAQIVGTVNSGGVTSTNTPQTVGDIAAGGNSPATIKYHVPVGIASFSTKVYLTANDACGTSYSYPGPYPGS